MRYHYISIVNNHKHVYTKKACLLICLSFCEISSPLTFPVFHLSIFPFLTSKQCTVNLGMRAFKSKGHARSVLWDTTNLTPVLDSVAHAPQDTQQTEKDRPTRQTVLMVSFLQWCRFIFSVSPRWHSRRGGRNVINSRPYQHSYSDNL